MEYLLVGFPKKYLITKLGEYSIKSKGSIEDKISRYFDDEPINFIKYKEEWYVTADSLGVGLEYKYPGDSVNNIFTNHKDELNKFSSVIKSITEGSSRKHRIYNEDGALLIIIFSRQPKAKKFREWIISVIKEIKHKGIYVDKKYKIGSLGYLRQQA